MGGETSETALYIMIKESCEGGNRYKRIFSKMLRLCLLGKTICG